MTTAAPLEHIYAQFSNSLGELAEDAMEQQFVGLKEL